MQGISSESANAFQLTIVPMSTQVAINVFPAAHKSWRSFQTTTGFVRAITPTTNQALYLLWGRTSGTVLFWTQPPPPSSLQGPNKDLITILSRENFTSDNACRKDGTALDLASGDLCLGEILTLQLLFRQIRSKPLAKSFPMKACWCFCTSHPPTPHRPWVWRCWCTVDGLPST